MTSELDKLRPEVRCALGDLSYISQANHTGQQQVDILRAELLRLAKENGDLRSVAGTIDTIGQRRARACEDELAALKARIAEAPIATVWESVLALDGVAKYLRIENNHPVRAGTRVRLLVED